MGGELVDHAGGASARYEYTIADITVREKSYYGMIKTSAVLPKPRPPSVSFRDTTAFFHNFPFTVQYSTVNS
jgi:hypothetical protein